uniref:Uncharacterized protein n=1 Tax=Tetradesmus obliquus TaxID=3088 RepID=A0A383WLF1_TETOB|eukprot:jgi/Sobl393_1/17383/SZX76836.1
MELRSALHGFTDYFTDMTGAEAFKTTAASDTPARNSSSQQAVPAEQRATPPDKHGCSVDTAIITAEQPPTGPASAAPAWRRQLPPPAFVLLGIPR